MDWNEPGLDAYEAIRRLHEHAATGSLGYEVQGYLDQGNYHDAAQHLAASGGFDGAERAAELLGWAHEQGHTVDVYGGYREAPMAGSDEAEAQAWDTFGEAGYDLGYGQGREDGYAGGYEQGYAGGYDQGYGAGGAAAATAYESDEPADPGWSSGSDGGYETNEFVDGGQP